MNRLSMVWVVPTVMGLLALTVSGVVRSQERDTSDVSGFSSAETKWNFSGEDGASLVAFATESDTQNVVNEKATERPEEVIPELPSSAPSHDLDDSDIKRLPDNQQPAEQDDLNSEADAKANDAAQVKENIAPNKDQVQDGPALLIDEMSEEQQLAAKKLQKAQSRSSLEQQFKKLQKTLETADAYSLALSEDYFGYGLLLRDDGQYDEALEAFVDALHIQKVNHGIYSTEQRPALKALFETHYSLGNVEDFEDYLERILWVESKNPNVSDDFSYKMLIMVGNRYIDQFLKKPVAGQGAVQTLLRAKHHLNAAFTRHRDKPLTVALMPYGELALISVLESRLLEDVDKTASMEDPRLRGSRNLNGRELALASYLSNSFPRGTGLLKSYLQKAQREENLPHVVKALIALGDFNQLFRRHGEATQYYNLAWTQAQSLAPDHELLAKFAAPTPLPAFDYALKREPIVPTKPSLMIPLAIDIDTDGRVTKVVAAASDPELKRYFTRARRIAKRLAFRPAMVDGKAQSVTGLPFKARVYARRGSKQAEQAQTE